MWRLVMIGVGFRKELAGWIDNAPLSVECLEITAEHFFHGGDDKLEALSNRFELFVHGLGLSLGTPGQLDHTVLENFAQVVRLADPSWISEHIAFTRTIDGDLGHLNPVPTSREHLKIVADHALEVSARCQKPMLLENITSHVQLPGDMSETDFLNELCHRANCGLLLDVTNLFVNSRNHGYNPLKWLREIEPALITQLHIVGYSRDGDRFTDSHSKPIQEELIELAQAVMAYAPVKAIILERDDDFPNPCELEIEIEKLRKICGQR
jgi:uncharacterized protein (UPF0276 family)